MRNLFFFIFFLFNTINVFGQSNSAYEVQRKKINTLLNNRSAKFGQYDQSLTQRTGIFGLKTKKDMQRSIDILSEIVKTDNTIFRELKILLDYKDLEKNEAQTKGRETEARIKGYMRTITKLQQENDKIKSETLLKETEQRSFPYGGLALILVLLIFIIFLFRKKLTVG